MSHHRSRVHTCQQSAGKIISEFDKFDKLTSVHINSSDDQMLASGYTYGVKLYDLATGQVRCFNSSEPGVALFRRTHGVRILLWRSYVLALAVA